MSDAQHQSQLAPADNKFHVGNGDDGKHYWLTPPGLYAELDAEFGFDFDPCPYPLPDGFDGLTCDWGQSNYVNPPFGSIIHQGRKKGPTAWVRKAIVEWQKGKSVVLVYPVDKWVLMLLKAILGEHAKVRNLGDVRWLATEDGSRHRDDGVTAEVTRLCTDGTKNACSFLYGAAARAAFALGFKRIGTYILASESGVSLTASGWRLIGERGGGSWSVPSRPRVDKHPLQKKLLFEQSK